MSSMHLSHVRKWLLQSPPVEWAIMQLRELLIGALRQGPMPQHIAFVMDGNRRFARSHGIETVEGHNLGFEALAKVHKVRLGRDSDNTLLISIHFRSSKSATSPGSKSLPYTPLALKTSNARNTKSTPLWIWQKSSSCNWLSTAIS